VRFRLLSLLCQNKRLSTLPTETTVESWDQAGLAERIRRIEETLRVTTHRRIAILRVFLNPDFTNMPSVPLQRKEEETLSRV